MLLLLLVMFVRQRVPNWRMRRKLPHRGPALNRTREHGHSSLPQQQRPLQSEYAIQTPEKNTKENHHISNKLAHDMDTVESHLFH